MTHARSVGPWCALIVAVGLLLAVSSCGGSEGSTAVDSPAVPDAEAAAAPVEQATALPEGRPALLSEWGQLRVVDGRLGPEPDVVPYTLQSPLFSDYAHKLRTVSLPADAGPLSFDGDDVLDFPVGTVITKTFYYPVGEAAPPGQVVRVRTAESDIETLAPLDLDGVRLIETRVLARRDDGWQALPYVWNAEQTDAVLARTGELVGLTLVDAERSGDAVGDGGQPFVYSVPNVNQCASCHAVDHTAGVVQPIGPAARHLDVMVDYGGGPEPQLAAWRSLGMLAPDGAAVDDGLRAVAWNDDSAPLDQRARAYLDINCAHCHNRVGPADTSGLFLEASADANLSLGICKPPIAAGTGTGGRLLGIVPGAPDESIFVYRMASTDPASMMPELGRAVVHDEGVELIAAWIDSLEGTCG